MPLLWCATGPTENKQPGAVPDCPRERHIHTSHQSLPEGVSVSPRSGCGKGRVPPRQNHGLPEVVFRNGRRVELPAMCPFTKLHEIRWKRATSASQLGPTWAADETLLVHPTLLSRRAILPDNRPPRAVHPNSPQWCVRRRATSGESSAKHRPTTTRTLLVPHVTRAQPESSEAHGKCANCVVVYSCPSPSGHPSRHPSIA